MSTADGYVLPKPGIPKTLGILNIIFGVLFVLGGLCMVGFMAGLPALMKFAEKTVKDSQSKLDAQNQSTEKAYDEQIAAAKTDEEKKAIEDQKAAFIASRPKLAQPDMSAATDMLSNHTVMAYTYGNLVSGLLLQIILLISGIGLVRLTPWGRSLALWWGGLQIIQVVILLVLNIQFMLPIAKVNNEKQIAKLEDLIKTKPNAPEAAGLPMMKAMTPFQLPMAIGSSMSGVVYPIIVLILLSTQGAKAACLGPKAREEEQF